MRPFRRLRVPSWRGNERWSALTLVLLVGYAIVFLATFRAYGLTWDEPAQATYGAMIVDWYRSGFANRAVLQYKNLANYGGLFDALGHVLARFSPLNLFETRHVLSGCFGMLGLWYAYRLAAYLATPSAGFLATLFLVLTPVYYGHAFNNPKDTPFAALFLVALYYLIRTIRYLPAIPWPLTLRLGIAVGATLGVRLGGIVLIGYFVLGFLAWFAVRVWNGGLRVRWRSAVVPYATRLVVVVATAWVIMLVWWPAAQRHPVWHLVETWRVLGKFPWPNTVLFAGRDIPASELPWDYLPRTALLTLPEFLFFALLIGGISTVRPLRRRGESTSNSPLSLEVGLVGLAAVFPAIYATVSGATLYDGLRHFLFLIPILAVLGAVGVSRFLQRRSRLVTFACGAVLAVGMAATAIDMVELHPYQYVYFNRLIGGGLRGAAGLYETDYWGNSYREGVEWIVNHSSAIEPSHRPIRVASCSNPQSTSYFLHSARFRYVYLVKEPADVFLATTRWHCDQAMPGRVVHRVQRQGVTLLYIKVPYKSAAVDSDVTPSASETAGAREDRLPSSAVGSGNWD